MDEGPGSGSRLAGAGCIRRPSGRGGGGGGGRLTRNRRAGTTAPRRGWSGPAIWNGAGHLSSLPLYLLRACSTRPLVCASDERSTSQAAGVSTEPTEDRFGGSASPLPACTLPSNLGSLGRLAWSPPSWYQAGSRRVCWGAPMSRPDKGVHGGVHDGEPEGRRRKREEATFFAVMHFAPSVYQAPSGRLAYILCHA